MTTSEEQDPFSAHFKRDPLPGAGIRIVMLTKLPYEQAEAVIAPLSERPWRGQPAFDLLAI